MTETEETAFYLSIEEGVRKYVRLLRDEGINTVCSCHHEGYIQCDSHDPTWERRVIWQVLQGVLPEDWTATLHVNSLISSDVWETRSEYFKTKEQS